MMGLRIISTDLECDDLSIDSVALGALILGTKDLVERPNVSLPDRNASQS
jgi:hypothetical protein